MVFSNSQLQAVLALAKKAGHAILEVYESQDLQIQSKSGGSPVTRADTAAHQVIVGGLKAIEPTLPVLSEESKALPYAERRQWDSYWLVDPLDGTKEFIKRNGEFTVNIACIQDDKPVLGVIHAPALDVTYYARHGEGAFRQSAQARPVRIASCSQNGSKTRIVASRSHLDDRIQRYLEKLKNYELVTIGSSLKFCLVAEGKADVYLRLGPTMEWDTAAGQCLVDVAGGVVTDLQGSPLLYNKPNLLNPDFIVMGCHSIPWETLLGGNVEKEAPLRAND